MIEAALLELLEPLSVRQGRYLERLDQYNGEVGAGANVDEILHALGGRVPAVLLQTGASSYSGGSIQRNRTRVTLQIEILIASGHLRSHESRNLGDESSVHDGAADPGAYQIMADIREALDGHRLGIAGASSPRLVSEQIAVQTPTLTAWISRFEIDYRRDQITVPQAGVVVTSIDARTNLDDSAAVNPVAVGRITANE